MSCSACYHCFSGVPYYDKYCRECRKRFKLPDLPDYQKGVHWPSDEERLRQFVTDRGTGKGKP